jgi:hypothetical protein
MQGHRMDYPASTEASAPAPAINYQMYSPDGRWWWNGQQWLATQAQAPLVQVNQMNMATRQGTNHVFHLIMCFFTVGLWFPIWMIVWAVNSGRR